MLKRFSISLFCGLLILVIPVAASAHVVVTPAKAGVAQELIFNVSVPNEQQTPVVNIKLEIPDGVTNVIPTTKDGWTITTPSDGNIKNHAITAINWTGSIPVGQRQDFTFSAQVPGQATEIDWKAYQTYGDGTIVHWDQKPAGSDDASGNAGPYSVTNVVDDLNPTSSTKNSSQTGAYIISGIALAVALISITIKRK